MKFFSDARRAAPLLALCAILPAAGCDQAAPSEGEDEATIKLGFFAHTEGSFHDEANVSLVLMAMREINESGGLVLGDQKYLLDLETAPFEDPSGVTASSGFDDLVAAGVSGVLGPPWSSQLLGSAGEQDGAWRRAVAHGMVSISESATSSLITDLDDDGLVFRMMPPDSLQAQIGAQEVWDSGQRRVALLYRNDPYGAGLAAEFSVAFEGLGGQIVADVPYEVENRMSGELGSYDFDTELDAVFSATPDLIYLATFDEVVQISRRIEERDDIAELPTGDVAFFGSDSLYDPAVVESTSLQVLDRLRGTAAGVDATSEDFSQFTLALEAAGIGQPWSASAQLYDAVYVFALAMQAADSGDPTVYKHEVGAVTRFDADDVVVYVDDFSRAREALRSGKGVDYQGASGPIELNEAGDPSAGAYLIWRAQLAADGAITFEMEKVISF